LLKVHHETPPHDHRSVVAGVCDHDFGAGECNEQLGIEEVVLFTVDHFEWS
jgi:hypothetical protein